jgi:transcriptional regulator with XRE-family HTH domain
MATVSPVDSAQAVTPDGEAPVPVTVTIDQIVAANVRYWRKAAGMTQEDLGDATGWSAANVSAVERSADEGRERRRLDAQALTQIALALGVPLIALFLPPGDDGAGKTYRFAGDAAGTLHGMRELTEHVVMPDSDDDSPVMDLYRQRLTEAADRYLDTAWGKEIARLLGQAEDSQARAARIARLRLRQADLLRAAAELADIAGALEAAGGTP